MVCSWTRCLHIERQCRRPVRTVTTASSKTITVRSLPIISDVSPSTGLAGTQVTVTGTNFGATQGTSSLWLGTKVGIVETWTDGAITARIAAGASSGTVQVRLSDRKSNSLPLTVLTPVISNATPGAALRARPSRSAVPTLALRKERARSGWALRQASSRVGVIRKSWQQSQLDRRPAPYKCCRTGRKQ
jgi:hypothetical protein